MGDTHYDMPITEALERLDADPTLCSTIPFPNLDLKVTLQNVGRPGVFYVELKVPGREDQTCVMPAFLLLPLLAMTTEAETVKASETAAAANVADGAEAYLKGMTA